MEKRMTDGSNLAVSIIGPGEILSPFSVSNSSSHARIYRKGVPDSTIRLRIPVSVVAHTIVEVGVVARQDFLNRLSESQQAIVNASGITDPSQAQIKVLRTSEHHWQSYKRQLIAEIMSDKVMMYFHMCMHFL